ncbi:DODA-type extradiol aromatic ring-opening family dioxygenase [Paenibacillus beijingensis]|uniref:MFS transporter n=1 Tax=Paenibacillus beijingensis TaxID=1126833 RepID=A0A0D5NJZ0_9BACL|nr:class III extradiol ring-cleavage dioxygenase [Paenibacillus beijingensis]AJY75445.1 MFS transporter [Paenibacillus beijingensis]
MVPALFLAHGSPMIAIQDTPYTGFLADLGRKLQPKAIVIFTAHWESEVLTISAGDGTYDTIYDFGGFPEEMYRIQYPAKRSDTEAAAVAERLTATGIKVNKDMERGLDHGSWTLLRRMYPDADIPVVQVSVHPFLPPAEQYKIGEALRDLGGEDILVIGSGVTVHNLRALNWSAPQFGEPEPWAVEFDDWLIEKMTERDYEALFHYESEAPHARHAVPREEHFVPLFIALGAGSGDEARKPDVIYRGYELGALSYLSLAF